MIHKARHYADLIIATKTEDECKAVLGKVVLDLFKETKELVVIRHVKVDAGLYGILSEINLKWWRIVDICHERKIILKERGFMDMILAVSPEVYNAWALYRKKVQRARERSIL